nr:CPBP family intramembrane glutamic endopeptidase [Lysinibacillus timonensis]
MKQIKQIVGLLLSIIFVYSFTYYAFKESNIFWYIFTFTILIGIAISIIVSQLKDELPTWKYLLFGIGYGVILYGIFRLIYIILNILNGELTKSISKFITNYGPNNIWHYFLLLFIIVIGEEIFWRGYIQQSVKNWTSPFMAITLSSLLFALSFIWSWNLIVVIVIFVIGFVLGALYEWKKSIPLNIVAHEVFVLLLFLVIPFI